MIKVYKTDDHIVHEKTAPEAGAWIQLIQPTVNECKLIAEQLQMDVDDILTILDEEERARIEFEDNYTLIIVDIPTSDIRHAKSTYTTIPLGIILTDNLIVTVCTKDTPILQRFARGRVRDFSTKKKMRFVYQMLFFISSFYQMNLRTIDKKRSEIEERFLGDAEEVDLIELHELSSTLVYFATSLRANGVVLERISRTRKLEQFDEDVDLLEDVIIENQQAIEMTNIYQNIINGTRELISSINDNRLNNVMKYLTSITIVMAIPTVISGFYGMNVDAKWMPFASVAHGFGIICGLTIVICGITMLVLKKKKMM
ncbi:MAG: magnesium transporter CorA family protein [Lachnospiraceae bacterium]|nr:magnesium transporter CorA family protein [Lachnospiraceae bacterium]